MALNAKPPLGPTKQPALGLEGRPQQRRLEIGMVHQGAAGENPNGADFAVHNPEVLALQALLQIEQDARQVRSEKEFPYFAANESRRLLNARQIFVFSGVAKSHLSLAAISSMTSVDPETPLVTEMQKLGRKIATDEGGKSIRAFTFDDFNSHTREMRQSYPFGYFLWTPLLSRKGMVFAGLLFARETAWTADEGMVAERLAGAYAHAWSALVPRLNKPTLWGKMRARVQPAFVALLLIGAGFIPVPISALAPAEIIAAEPIIYAAQIEGVIKSIDVEPGASVLAGQKLVHFEDASIRGQYDIANRNVQLAEAKVQQFSQASFVDLAARREVAVAKADFEVKQAERDFAADLQSKTVIVAEHSGVALFDDKRQLIGKPVPVGQRILEIADPNQVELRIDLGVSDSLVLKNGARVKVFLDSDPLHPIEGKITQASAEAHIIEGNVLAYRVDAKLDLAGRAVPRIGIRGTAEVFGDRWPLAFYLFRRPLTFVRQRLGL